MAKQKNTFEVTVQITPVSGKPETKTVTVPASATVLEVAEAAGIAKKDLEKRNFFVDGEPATLETRVTSASAVKFTERPQGS